jgi:hypothetical protein
LQAKEFDSYQLLIKHMENNYRILKTERSANAYYYPQERKSFLGFKYWSYYRTKEIPPHEQRINHYGNQLAAGIELNHDQRGRVFYYREDAAMNFFHHEKEHGRLLSASSIPVVNE